MKRTTGISIGFTVLLLWSVSALGATTKTVTFNTRDPGVRKAITNWGEDATWVNYYNARKSAEHAGPEIDFVRIGFYLHEPFNDDGSLSTGQIKMLDGALKFADMIDEKIPIMLSPHNEKGIIDWYKNPNGSAHLDRWYNVMVKSKDYIESKGHRVASIEVFNEPDWAKWNMGKRDDLDELLERCKPWGVLRVGPSTMSTNQAEGWYKKIQSNVEAGSTHTINGTMAQYIDLIETVKDDRKLFMNPEVHSMVEVIVGAEVGIDAACWWDQINKGCAAFMKACQGRRIAYVAVEENWSAACVYRGPDGILHGFASTNERGNGVETIYRFVCTDEDATYYLEGDAKQGVFIKKGEAFQVQAKIPGQGKKSITQWFTIVPASK